MQESAEEISLAEAFKPCGADCYGIFEIKVCDEAIDEELDLPEAFGRWTELWYSVVHQGIETPAVVTLDHYYRMVAAGVEDWRLLTRAEDCTIDLFSQRLYVDKLVTGDLLYVPPGTFTQHTALTPLSVALGNS